MGRGHRYDGNVLRDTDNQVASKRMRAERDKCPKCGRKAALVSWFDGLDFYIACRWGERGLCDYVQVRRDATDSHTDARGEN